MKFAFFIFCAVTLSTGCVSRREVIVEPAGATGAAYTSVGIKPPPRLSTAPRTVRPGRMGSGYRK